MRDFFASVFNSQSKGRNITNGIILPKFSKTAGMSSISYLYQYINTPPLAQGSPAPKVAESVNRSTEYNRLPNSGRNDVDYGDRQFWLNSDGDYPFSEITSNFHLGAAKKMLEDFLVENHAQIDRCALEVWNKLRNTNADILTKGRQTWDPVNERSVPSADAFKTIEKIIRINTKRTSNSCLEFIRTFCQMLALDKLVYEQKVEYEGNKRLLNNVTGMFEYKPVRKVRTEIKTVEGHGEVRRTLMSWACSFCSYLKSKERSKLKRRAIASPNMFMRMFLLYIEEFHLLLGKRIRGSTISIGGEEKKIKIMAEMNNVKFFPDGASIQVTEDKTKWNECLSPELFALMHYIWFNKETREKLSLPAISDELVEMGLIMQTGNYLISKKTITLGPGHICTNGHFDSRFSWSPEDKPKMNNRTREWFEKCENDVIGNKKLFAPYGMLMGMMNAASTTLALITTKYRLDPETEDCSCVMSSDDSMSIYTNSDPSKVHITINKVADNLKMVGMNISTKKSRAFREGVGEYTSAYSDSTFQAQYGVETAKLRPQGKNPHDDFHSIAISTSTAQREMKMNTFGAEASIALGVANVRRLWRIRLNGIKRKGVRGDVMLLSDGGQNPWDSTNCHLHEIAIKRNKYAPLSSEEDLYFDRIMNPTNPFTTRDEPQSTYSLKHGGLIEMECDTPRVVFNYIRRSNATVGNNEKNKEILEQRACALAVSVYETLNPVAAVFNPTGMREMSISLVETMSIAGSLLTEGGTLTPGEKDEIDHAVRILMTK